MWCITGVTGFLGYSFLKEWERRGRPFPLRVLVRDVNHPVLRPYQGKIEIVQGSLEEDRGLHDFCQGAEGVLHMAAAISFLPRTRSWMYKVNVEGTRYLVNAALEAKVQKFIYISSIAALGRPASPQEPIHEDTIWQDSPYNTHYGYTKYLGEKEVWRGHEEGLSVLIFNPGIILGPYISWDKGSPAFFRMVWKGLLAYPVGTNGFVGVEDVVKAIFTGIAVYPEGWNQRYVLVAENWRYKRLFEEIAQVLSKKPPRLPVPPQLAVGVGIAMEYLGSLFGLPAAATRETARTSSAHFLYDGSRITRTWPAFEYTPLQKVIQETGKMFLESYAGQTKRRVYQPA